MDLRHIDCGALPVSVHVSCFRGASGVDEYHLMVQPHAQGGFGAQLEWVAEAYSRALESLGLTLRSAVLRRFFCSDLSNQAAELEAQGISNPHDADEPCAVSWVGQPPLPPSKVALWAYHVNDPAGGLDKALDGETLTLTRGELVHRWTTGLRNTVEVSSYEQTRCILRDYDAFLGERNMTMADHLIRTWFFVRDIDTNYKGLVVARREFFAEHGLTPETHFVASSGIEGLPVELAAKVALDAYAVAGVRGEQIEYLSALEHLSMTHVYGVTFERGTSVAYRDRKHVVLSGTASIDHKGEILYPGDVLRQLDRTMENMEALLARAGAGLTDMCHFIVYVRDPGDQAEAQRRMRERFGDAPIVVVVAPVCRPGWLIEVEGMAIVAGVNEGLPAF